MGRTSKIEKIMMQARRMTKDQRECLIGVLDAMVNEKECKNINKKKGENNDACKMLEEINDMVELMTTTQLIEDRILMERKIKKKLAELEKALNDRERGS